MNLSSPLRLNCLSTIVLFVCFLLVISIADSHLGNAGDEQVVNAKTRIAAATPNHSSSNVVDQASWWGLLAKVKTVHPLVIAGAQLLIVLGICLLLTDNKELELYFKIDFRPPKTDILN